MKAKLLSSATPFAPPIAVPNKGAKPIATIGTMQRNTTAAQRQAFHKMKLDMKRAARAMRYDQHLQENETRDKP